jgi:hypothetical protein
MFDFEIVGEAKETGDCSLEAELGSVWESGYSEIDGS